MSARDDVGAVLARFRALADEWAVAEKAWFDISSDYSSDYARARNHASALHGAQLRALCDAIERERREALYPEAIHAQMYARAWAAEARDAYDLGYHGPACLARHNAARLYARARRLLGIEEP